MIDPTNRERVAMNTASIRAGQFIESIGKTDMAQYTEKQWLQLIEVIVGGYVERMSQLTDDEIPF